MLTEEILRQYVEERTKEVPPFVDAIQLGSDTVAGDVPFRLKLGIAISELTTFASHLRKPIKLYDGTIVPVNAIVFALSASGTSKDKSLNAIRKSMKRAYTKLQENRLEEAEKLAKKKARTEGDGTDEWRKHYKDPKPLQTGLGTAEGLIHHFADIARGKFGAGSVTSSEIGAELQTNGQMSEIIKAVAVAYDLGNIPAKIIKSAEGQTAEIKGLPVNALFFGSQEAILFNNDIKSKFRMIFNTQLARRSTFVFTPEVSQPPTVTSIDELYKLREQERERVLEAQEKLNAETYKMIEEVTQDPLELTEDASKLFDVYLEYNAVRSENISNKFPISKLSQKHKQWLALKLAGAYAIFERAEEITERIYATAIKTTEMLSEDLRKFEYEMIKEPYELFVDLCHYNSEDGEFFVSLHELRKLGYIQGTGASKPKLEDLALLSSSCDAEGDYEATAHGIQHKALKETDTVGVSYKIFDSSLEGEAFKKYAVVNCEKGYEFFETTFDELEMLLQENAAYSPFQFNGGVRGKDNVQGGTKFVVLDIDTSFLKDTEIHELLGSYNHYVVRTSDKENAFKFRVLLELDASLDVEDAVWKALVVTIGTELGFTVDALPKSQIFISFANRDILTQFNGKALPTKELLEKAKSSLKDKPVPPTSYSPKVKTQKLADPRETFNFAFEATPGNRSISMYKALAYAIDLGATKDYVTNLANEINGYWVSPLNEDRLQKTLVIPALRKLS